MSQPYIGEIRMFAGNFPPAGWAFCEGQLLPISENDALFNLIGTTYGGDGQETFALPDLRGRVPIHFGTGPGLSSRILAETGGAEEVTLTTQQIPAHTHPVRATQAIADQPLPQNHLLARPTNSDIYTGDPPDTSLAANAIGPTGGSQPHTNFQPYLCVNFIISLFGVFPQQN